MSTAADIAVQNLLLCDAAHRDASSGKWTLLGIFNSINSKGFPTTHPQLVAYLAVAGIKGKEKLQIRVIPSGKADEAVFRAEAELSVEDPKAVVDVGMPIRGMVFTKPGEYLFQVLHGEKVVGEKSLIVTQVS
jgi:hypothetical protein